MPTTSLALLSTINPARFLILLGLSFFLGLAYEEFYNRKRTVTFQLGGLRTFPILSLTGALLYLLEPQYALMFGVGLIIVGSWLYAYYKANLKFLSQGDESRVSLLALTCNILAYALGPATLLASGWLAVGIVVTTVLLLSARAKIHTFSEKIPADEIVTSGKFLLLVGIILPLLPQEPLPFIAPLTPYQIWLAVVVLCSLSYSSYLLQRYVSQGGGILMASLLGGLYSSTATTVVLARRIHQKKTSPAHFQAGLLLATAMMYLRLCIIIAVLNIALARLVAPYLLGLFSLSLIFAWLFKRKNDSYSADKYAVIAEKNPLELTTALVFATVFVVISVIVNWAKQSFGESGIFAIAGLIGVVDIDPFVLSLAQTSSDKVDLTVAAVSVLIAASSNNILKGVYALVFSQHRASILPFCSLILLALLGISCVYVMFSLHL